MTVTRRYVGLILVFAAVLGVAFGCGEGDGEGEAPSNEKFTFVEGEPGTFAGAYATVEFEGETFESNEIEVLLQGSSDVDGADTVFGDPQEAAQQGLMPESENTAMMMDADRFGSGLQAPDYELPMQPDALRLAANFDRAIEEIDDISVEPRPTAMLESSDRLDGCDTGPHVASTVETIGAWDGWTCWMEMTGSVEQAGVVTNYNWTTHLAPEGVYFGLSIDTAVSVPPSFVGAGWSSSFGCVEADQGTHATVEYLDNLDSISIDYSAFAQSMGLTFYYGGGVTRGLELSYGVSIDLDPFFLFPLSPISFPISISLPLDVERSAGPLAIRGWEASCLDDPIDADGPADGLDTGMQQASQGSAEPSMALQGESGSGGMTAVAELTGPFFGWLNSPTGVGTADNIPAGSQADWFGEWFDSGTTDECSDCSNTSINALTRGGFERIAAGVNNDDDSQTVYGGMWMAESFMRNSPEFTIQETMQEGVDAAVNASYHDLLARGAQMQDDDEQYISPETLRYPTKADEVVEIPVTADEIAELIGVDEADVQGASVCITTFRDDDEVCGELDGDAVVFNYESSDPEPRLFTVEVGLTGADGFDESDVEEWQVQPARRLIIPDVDTPSQVLLSAGPTTISGSPVTLNATLVDDNQRFVERPATFSFYDAHGELLAEVDSDDGRATHQFIPEPVSPQIDDAELVTLDYNGGDIQGAGYVIEGARFSRRADIIIDGEPLSRDDYLVQVENSGFIIVGPSEPTDDPPFSGATEIEVINYGGHSDVHSANFE